MIEIKLLQLFILNNLILIECGINMEYGMWLTELTREMTDNGINVVWKWNDEIGHYGKTVLHRAAILYISHCT